MVGVGLETGEGVSRWRGGEWVVGEVGGEDCGSEVGGCEVDFVGVVCGSGIYRLD